MKFFAIFVLLVATLVCSEPIFDIDKMLKKIDALGILGEVYKFFLDDCISELKPYTHCTFKYEYLTEAQVRNECKVYLKSDCQNFIQNPLTYAPSCDKLPDFAVSAALTLGQTVARELDIVCSTDESGKACPLVTFYTQVKPKDEDFTKITPYKENTCKSKQCTKVARASFETLDKFDEIKRKTRTTLYKNRKACADYFKSKTCTNQQK
ncbi:hypothetical protein BCR32DRAFT_330380 [Anaeromyces robustus]|uniref:Uncharacterized protein n=1 Tax=Anaeromyces robustus TaxID=1754192 RepID=A0A1Y1VWG9_9FUNG|nr:hypothetical protein BCR32DRAFT_330380 [Anaeromyces robustus]|eukprot:ORX65365.1 hypothetical protein BCR32DRAFT_330380 [Anaeromyces robustus]